MHSFQNNFENIMFEEDILVKNLNETEIVSEIENISDSRNDNTNNYICT